MAEGHTIETYGHTIAGRRSFVTPSRFFCLLFNAQYTHYYWVMHKCIMVKVGGKNTRKVCKKQVNLPKTGGKFVKDGGKNNFRETGGKCSETAKIGGNSKFVVDD